MLHKFIYLACISFTLANPLIAYQEDSFQVEESQDDLDAYESQEKWATELVEQLGGTIIASVEKHDKALSEHVFQLGSAEEDQAKSTKKGAMVGFFLPGVVTAGLINLVSPFRKGPDGAAAAGIVAGAASVALSPIGAVTGTIGAGVGAGMDSVRWLKRKIKLAQNRDTTEALLRDLVLLQYRVVQKVRQKMRSEASSVEERKLVYKEALQALQETDSELSTQAKEDIQKALNISSKDPLLLEKMALFGHVLAILEEENLLTLKQFEKIIKKQNLASEDERTAFLGAIYYTVMYMDYLISREIEANPKWLVDSLS